MAREGTRGRTAMAWPLLIAVGALGCTYDFAIIAGAGGGGGNGSGAGGTGAGTTTTTTGVGGSGVGGGLAGCLPADLPTEAYADLVLGTADLVGYWRLGDTTAVATDSAGQALDGAYVGFGYTQGEPGAIAGDDDSATRFDGETGRVEVPSTALLSFEGTAHFTIESWVKPGLMGNATAPVAGKRTAEDGSNQEDGYLVHLATTSGEIKFRRYRDVDKDTATGPTLPLGVFSHVVAVFDGGFQRIYVNGCGQDPHATSFDLRPTTVPFIIGGDPGIGFLEATIDDVSVYARALSATEVQEHYAAGL